jgi:hypothetical protein
LRRTIRSPEKLSIDPSALVKIALAGAETMSV